MIFLFCSIFYFRQNKISQLEYYSLNNHCKSFLKSGHSQFDPRNINDNMRQGRFIESGKNEPTDRKEKNQM